MTSRQRIPVQWSIISGELSTNECKAAVRQSHGTGVLLLERPRAADLRRLRIAARLRRLTIVIESPSCASRVHNVHELRRALLRRCPLILLSPIHPTTSHPDWQALPRMRAAALARLAGRQLLALGGMNPKRFRIIAPLGFAGWAGITAWQHQPGLCGLALRSADGPFALDEFAISCRTA